MTRDEFLALGFEAPVGVQDWRPIGTTKMTQTGYGMSVCLINHAGRESARGMWRVRIALHRVVKSPLWLDVDGRLLAELANLLTLAGPKLREALGEIGAEVKR